MREKDAEGRVRSRVSGGETRREDEEEKGDKRGKTEDETKAYMQTLERGSPRGKEKGSLQG